MSIDWDKQPLGQVKDDAIAEALGVTESIVKKARRSRGIPSACMPNRRSPRRFDELRAIVLQHADQLGRRSDTLLGEEIGVRRQVVTQVRMELGIPAVPKGGPSRARRDIPREAFDGRTVAQLAIAYGCCTTTVRKRRSEHGIEPPPWRHRHKHDWTSVDWSQTDHQIARQLGACPESVARKRRKDAPIKYRRK